PAAGAGQQEGNAELVVEADQRLIGGGLDAVGLVQANDRRDAALLGAGEVAVDQVRLEVRLDERDDDDHLIDVGDDDLLAPLGGARQQAVPRLDALDHALVAAHREDPDAVAGGDDVALVGRERFQQAAHRTAEPPAVVGLDDALLVNADDAPGQAGADVHR